MYRDDKTYDEIKQVIINIYLDYDIKNFPLDEKEICRKMGVALVPYSELGLSAQPLLVKHYVFGDKDDGDDDLADFFARYFMCPIPYLIIKKMIHQMI